jgi:hypothetical protein
MLQVGQSGWNLVEHSVCNNCENQEDWKWIKGRTALVKLCWSIDAVSKEGVALKLPFVCEYSKDKPEEQNCKTKIEDPHNTKLSCKFKMTICLCSRQANVL